jgi:hypothetical protein
MRRAGRNSLERLSLRDQHLQKLQNVEGLDGWRGRDQLDDPEQLLPHTLSGCDGEEWGALDDREPGCFLDCEVQLACQADGAHQAEGVLIKG